MELIENLDTHTWEHVSKSASLGIMHIATGIAVCGLV